MQLEKIYNRPLNQEESTFKEAYLSGDKTYWEKPLTFAKYEQLISSGKLISTQNSHNYKDLSEGKLGNTVMDPETTYNVNIAMHQRYCYPVLHNHAYIEIIYVAAGHCINHLENSSIDMREGDVCIMAPNAFHAVSCLNDESCIMNIMVSKKFFNANFLDTLLGGKVISGFFKDVFYHKATCPYILLTTGADTWLHELARRMLTENTLRRHAYDYSISLLASAFLLQLSREYEATAIVPGKSEDNQSNLIVGILAYLGINYNHVTLSQAASFFGYSEAYFSRYIHQNTGKTFNSLVSELQMEKAKSFLDEGNMSLTEIAQEVGCFDSSHFSKKFKSVYGITPKEYQKGK